MKHSALLTMCSLALWLGWVGSIQAQSHQGVSKVPVQDKAAIQPAQLMAALSLIESGDNDRAVGRAGEVSRYQIMPFVWRAYGGGNPRNAAEAKRVATRIMGDRIAKFQAKHNRPPTMVEVYALWRSPARAMQLKLSAAVKDCGQRFSNLVKESLES